MNAKIYFVRHGQTNSNATGILYNNDDDTHGLNEIGRGQAHAAGQKLAKVDLHRVFSGTSKRHLETAQIIVANRGLKIETDVRLNERNFGEFTGKKYKPKDQTEFDVEAFFSWGAHQVFQTAETMQDCETRIHGIINEKRIQFPGKNILMVGSGGSGSHAKSFGRGRSNHYYLQNCEIYEIEN
jgi:probable phosphoglycerate mutase